MDVKLIYYGDCQHYFCDDVRSSFCIKRYIDVVNCDKQEYRIAICNDYIRLKIKENDINNCNGYYNGYHKVISDIVFELVPNSYNRNHIISKINPEYQYKICDRPYLTRYVDLFTAVGLIHDSPWANYGSKEFRERTYFHLSNVVKHMATYKKYGRYKKEINSIMLHLKPWEFDTKNSTRITKLYTIFFDIITNLKSYEL